MTPAGRIRRGAHLLYSANNNVAPTLAITTADQATVFTKEYSWCKPPSTDFERTATPSPSRWRDPDFPTLTIMFRGPGSKAGRFRHAGLREDTDLEARAAIAAFQHLFYAFLAHCDLKTSNSLLFGTSSPAEHIAKSCYVTRMSVVRTRTAVQGPMVQRSIAR